MAEEEAQKLAAEEQEKKEQVARLTEAHQRELIPHPG